MKEWIRPVRQDSSDSDSFIERMSNQNTNVHVDSYSRELSLTDVVSLIIAAIVVNTVIMIRTVIRALFGKL